MKLLQSQPKVSNKKIDSYDLYHAVIKNIDDKRIS